MVKLEETPLAFIGWAVFIVRLTGSPVHGLTAYLELIRMTDGYRQRIGGIVTGRDGQSQQDAHHLLYLHLLGIAIPNHRLLDHPGRVIMDSKSMLHGGQNRDAPGMS
jgi:hypothetical protein